MLKVGIKASYEVKPGYSVDPSDIEHFIREGMFITMSKLVDLIADNICKLCWDHVDLTGDEPENKNDLRYIIVAIDVPEDKFSSWIKIQLARLSSEHQRAVNDQGHMNVLVNYDLASLSHVESLSHNALAEAIALQKERYRIVEGSFDRSDPSARLTYEMERSL